jgi:hypothetical protein
MTSNADIHSIAKLGRTCPVLGLPVHREPAWHYQSQDVDYTHQFVIVGDRILISEPVGDPSFQDLRHVLHKIHGIAGTGDKVSCTTLPSHEQTAFHPSFPAQ